METKYPTFNKATTFKVTNLTARPNNQQPSKTTSNIPTVKKWSIMVGLQHTGKTRYAKEYSSKASHVVQVIPEIHLGNFGYKLTALGDAQEVIVETHSPYVAGCIDVWVRKTYGATPAIWAFVRQDDVVPFLSALSGLAIEKILFVEHKRNSHGTWVQVDLTKSTSLPTSLQPNKSTTQENVSNVEAQFVLASNQTLPMAERISHIVKQANEQNEQNAARASLCGARLETDQQPTRGHHHQPSNQGKPRSQSEESPSDDSPRQASETPSKEEPSQSEEGQSIKSPSQALETPSKEKPSRNEDVQSIKSPSHKSETSSNDSDTPSRCLKNKQHEWSFAQHLVATLCVLLLANLLLKVLLQEVYVPVVFWGQDMPMVTVYVWSACETLVATATEVVCNVVFSLGWSVWEPIRNAKTTYQQRVAWWTWQANHLSVQDDMDSQVEEDEFDFLYF